MILSAVGPDFKKDTLLSARERTCSLGCPSTDFSDAWQSTVVRVTLFSSCVSVRKGQFSASQKLNPILRKDQNCCLLPCQVEYFIFGHHFNMQTHEKDKASNFVFYSFFLSFSSSDLCLRLEECEGKLDYKGCFSYFKII